MFLSSADFISTSFEKIFQEYVRVSSSLAP